MPEIPFNPDAKSLEDAFFARENAALLEAMRKKAAHKERLDALRGVMPNADDALLERLLELGVSAQTILAMLLLPLARVAWADGVIDAKERAAILKAAEERDIRRGPRATSSSSRGSTTIPTRRSWRRGKTTSAACARSSPPTSATRCARASSTWHAESPRPRAASSASGPSPRRSRRSSTTSRRL